MIPKAHITSWRARAPWLLDPDFRNDVAPLLRPGFSWDFEPALDVVLQKLVALLAGEPWKGIGDERAKAEADDA